HSPVTAFVANPPPVAALPSLLRSPEAGTAPTRVPHVRDCPKAILLHSPCSRQCGAASVLRGLIPRAVLRHSGIKMRCPSG
ncbi:unnamed protein product, partial [Urochloa humidicola]